MLGADARVVGQAMIHAAIASVVQRQSNFGMHMCMMKNQHIIADVFETDSIDSIKRLNHAIFNLFLFWLFG